MFFFLLLIFSPFSSQENLRKSVNIALVGKYTELEDSYASVVKALQHAGLAVKYKVEIAVSTARKSLIYYFDSTFFALKVVLIFDSINEIYRLESAKV